MNIEDVVKGKGKTLFTVTKSALAVDAVAILDEHRVGALLVIDEKEYVVGIISERDILYKCYKSGEPLKEKNVESLMTKVEDIIVGEIHDTPGRLMNMMVNGHIRHIPIMEDKIIVGIVSIDDLLNLLLENSEIESRKLREYIKNPYGIQIYTDK